MSDEMFSKRDLEDTVSNNELSIPSYKTKNDQKDTIVYNKCYRKLITGQHELLYKTGYCKMMGPIW